MPSRFIPIAAGTDPSQQLATINKNFGELDAENVKKLFYDANGTPSIQIGVQQDGSSRIRVAKAGIDVTTATDDQLAFNSAQNTLKVVESGSFTVTKPANVTSFSDGPNSVNVFNKEPLMIFYSSGSTSGLGYGNYTLGAHTIFGNSGSDAGRAVLSTGGLATFGGAGSNVALNFTIYSPNTGTNTYYSSSWTTNFIYYLLQESAV